MIGYISRRVLSLVPVLVIVALVSFFLIHFAAGDFANIYWRMHAGNTSPTKAQIEQIREERGLNDPLLIQFFRWFGEVIRLDFGKTLYTKEYVAKELTARLPYTLMLATAAVTIACIIGIPLGILGAIKAGRFLDGFIRVFASSGIAIPRFWLGLLLMYFLSYKLKLLPLMGSGTVYHLILPAITLGVSPAATLARLTRANMLEVMNNEYVSTAYAKGLPNSKVILKHVFRPALIPVITMIGLQFGFMFGGAVIVETVFSWPGIGKWAIDGIVWRDMPILRAFLLVMSLLFVTINLFVDIAYSFLDPRIRYWT